MRWILSLLVFAVFAAGTHFIILTGIPGFIMGKAHQTFEAQGVPENLWVPSPRQTPQTQRIVRPSPDLAYAICRFDTSKSAVEIQAPIGEGYGSLSIFNDQTDNVFVGDLSAGSSFQGVTVSATGGAGDVILDGPGIALIRRLAPSQADYNRAAALVADASCAPLVN